MVARTKKLDVYLRFDTNGWNGLGHATRCVELTKELKNKFNIILCTNRCKKLVIKDVNHKIILKKKNESEENYILRISNKLGKKILFIDNIYNYNSKVVKKITGKFQKIFFYQNFSSGIQRENIIFDPTPNLNSSKNVKKKFRHNTIYSGDNYLIIPKSRKYKKANYLGVTFGGSDPKNISVLILKYLKKIKWEYPTFIFVGSLSKNANILKKIQKQKNIKICKFNKKKLLKSSLTICSPGITAYELLINDIFSIYISHSTKHSNLGKYIEKKYNFAKNLGIYRKLKLNNFKKNLYFYWNNEILINRRLKKKYFYKNSCNEIKKIIVNETK